MKAGTPLAPGRVDWSGENPGILLKETADGPFSAMALFFRVAWSPVGQGHVLLLYQNPLSNEEGVGNVLIGDSPPLVDYLKDRFIARLPAFRDAPAFASLVHLPARSVRSGGDPMSRRYTETISAPGTAVQLVWEDLEAPRAMELPPELTGTRAHFMSTLLVPARQAHIFVNGRRLSGQPAKRVQAGLDTTTAFLYFSETWVIPSDG